MSHIFWYVFWIWRSGSIKSESIMPFYRFGQVLRPSGRMPDIVYNDFNVVWYVIICVSRVSVCFILFVLTFCYVFLDVNRILSYARYYSAWRRRQCDSDSNQHAMPATATNCTQQTAIDCQDWRPSLVAFGCCET